MYCFGFASVPRVHFAQAKAQLFLPVIFGFWLQCGERYSGSPSGSKSDFRFRRQKSERCISCGTLIEKNRKFGLETGMAWVRTLVEYLTQNSEYACHANVLGPKPIHLIKRL